MKLFSELAAVFDKNRKSSLFQKLIWPLFNKKKNKIFIKNRKVVMKNVCCPNPSRDRLTFIHFFFSLAIYVCTINFVWVEKSRDVLDVPACRGFLKVCFCFRQQIQFFFPFGKCAITTLYYLDQNTQYIVTLPCIILKNPVDENDYMHVVPIPLNRVCSPWGRRYTTEKHHSFHEIPPENP